MLLSGCCQHAFCSGSYGFGTLSALPFPGLRQKVKGACYRTGSSACVARQTKRQRCESASQDPPTAPHMTAEALRQGAKCGTCQLPLFSQAAATSAARSSRLGICQSSASSSEKSRCYLRAQRKGLIRNHPKCLACGEAWVSRSTVPYSAGLHPKCFHEAYQVIDQFVRDVVSRDVGASLKPLLLFGGPGTGKSLTTKATCLALRDNLRDSDSLARRRTRKRNHCEEEEIFFVLTAMTGILAQRIGGLTLHSWAGVQLAPTSQASEELLHLVRANEAAVKRWKSAVVLCVDDASRLPAALLDKLNYIAQQIRGSKAFFGGIALVLNFDFLQLLPGGPSRKDQLGQEIPSDLPFYEATCWEELQRCARLCALSTAHRFQRPSDTPSNTRFTGNADLSTLDILNMVRVNSSHSPILDDCFRYKLAKPLPPLPPNARPVHLFSSNKPL